MHTIFTLQIAVGKLAIDLHCTGFNAHLIARLIVEHLDLVAMCLTPTGVHTEQHISPIECLSTTGTGIYIDNSAHLILLATEHISKLKSLNCLYSNVIRLIKFYLRRKSFGNKVGHHHNLLDLCSCTLKIGNPTLYTGNLLQLLLRRIGVVPKVRLECLLLLVL